MAKWGKVIVSLVALISPDLEPPMDLYVYYRVLASDAQAFLASACAFLHRILQDTRLVVAPCSIRTLSEIPTGVMDGLGADVRSQPCAGLIRP